MVTSMQQKNEKLKEKSNNTEIVNKDWLQELEIQTCECDSRSLLQGPQFSLFLEEKSSIENNVIRMF